MLKIFLMKTARRVLVLFRRVTFSCTIPTYNSTGPLRPIYLSFHRATMASSGVGSTMGHGVRGIRPSQPEKIDADGTLFFVTFLMVL